MTIGIEEFLKTASAEQKKLLYDLADLAKKEQDLSEKINRVYSSVDKEIYSNDEGITLCENGDDANVISLGSKLELIDVRGNIAMLLKRAINELKMGDVGMIQRQYKNYVQT